MSRAAICCCDLLRFSSRSSDLGVVKYRDKIFLCQENFPPFKHNFLFCYVKIPPNFPSHISTLPISQKKTPHLTTIVTMAHFWEKFHPFIFHSQKTHQFTSKLVNNFHFFPWWNFGETKCCVFCCEKNACDSIFLTKKNTEKIHQKMRKIECQKYHFLSLQKKKNFFQRYFCHKQNQIEWQIVCKGTIVMVIFQCSSEKISWRIQQLSIWTSQNEHCSVFEACFSSVFPTIPRTCPKIETSKLTTWQPTKKVTFPKKPNKQRHHDWN